MAGRYRVQSLDEVPGSSISALVKCCGGESYSRRFSLAGGALCVEDSLVDGGSELGGVSRLHLAPEVSVLDVAETVVATVVLTSAGKITVRGARGLAVVPCEVSREYNKLLHTVCVEVSFRNNLKFIIEK